MRSFKRSNFFPLKKKYDVNNLLDLLEGKIIDNDIHKNFEINDVSSLTQLRNNSIIFLEKDYNNQKIKSLNIHVITNKPSNKEYYKNITLVENLNHNYNKLLNDLFNHDDQIGLNDEYNFVNGSHISKFSKIDNSCQIGKNCVISRGVEIGKDCIIKNNVVIKNALIRNDVVISDNTSIGTTGFGFNFKIRGSKYLNPQVGIVIIDENVHLGANCTIDRGKIDVTLIGKNSMIDNMVHIAHNVIIGKNACIAAQTGISGSVLIGDNVTIGGQVGLAGHIIIGDNVIIAAKSGVTKDIKDNSVVAGFPAIDMKKWKKNIVRQRKNGH